MPVKNAENVTFDLGAKLLPYLLWRKVLDGIETVDDLLACQSARIHIKQECLNEPLFLAGKPKGQGLQPGVPQRAGAMSTSVANLAQWCGMGRCSEFGQPRRVNSIVFHRENNIIRFPKGCRGHIGERHW